MAKGIAGTLVSVSGSSIKLSHDGGAASDHVVDPDANITVDGAKAKLADLKAGDEIVLSGNPALSVKATRA